MTEKLKLGVLASGRGTNLQSILEACKNGTLNAQVQIVISDVPGAQALSRAKKEGIATSVRERKNYNSKREFEETIIADLKEKDVQLVCLAGYMRLVGATFLAAFPNRVLNIHPALLPAFPGLDAQQQAWEYGVKIAGCTVHIVDEHTDHGPIICQTTVPVLEDDTAETLSERILMEEHKLYAQAIQLFAENRIEIEGRKVHIKEQKLGDRS